MALSGNFWLELLGPVWDLLVWTPHVCTTTHVCRRVCRRAYRQVSGMCHGTRWKALVETVLTSTVFVYTRCHWTSQKTQFSRVLLVWTPLTCLYTRLCTQPACSMGTAFHSCVCIGAASSSCCTMTATPHRIAPTASSRHGTASWAFQLLRQRQLKMPKVWPDPGMGPSLAAFRI